MASVAKSIVAQVVTQIRAADGAGVYSFDLRSATGRVKRGAPVAAYVDPVCDVWVQVVREDSEPGPAMTRHTRRLGIEVLGVVGRDFGASAGDREDGVLDLADTIMRALEADRGLSGQALDTLMTSAEIMDGSRLADRAGYGVEVVEELTGQPVVIIEIVVSYYVQTGV